RSDLFRPIMGGVKGKIAETRQSDRYSAFSHAVEVPSRAAWCSTGHANVMSPRPLEGSRTAHRYRGLLVEGRREWKPTQI
ncbi:MAG: hypothetical protein ABIT38_02295, partial [Gemmatimonadaceae bacterium]